MIVVAIDPGPVSSAYVTLARYGDPRSKNQPTSVLTKGILDNERLADQLHSGIRADHLAIEMVGCYGMPVGEETFSTCVWIGRFIQAWHGNFTYVYRRKSDVCESITMHLCNSHRGKDSNIRQALLDKFPATGGGRIAQIGTKEKPGPLHGMRTHLWSALAVGVTYLETRPARLTPIGE